jgi:aspartyl-tRNA(Asn)/glutamyl-tRNA(Gln) amidotransferase subunit C
VTSSASNLPIKHISKLANLDLSEAEVVFFEKNLSSVIEYMQKIGQLDVSSVSPTSRTSEEENVLREDAVIPSFSQDQALQNAPRKHDGYFVVPAVLDKD